MGLDIFPFVALDEMEFHAGFGVVVLSIISYHLANGASFQLVIDFLCHSTLPLLFFVSHNSLPFFLGELLL